MRDFLIGAIIGIAVLLLVRHFVQRDDPSVEVRSDTVIVRDTITIRYPVEVTRRVTDTIRIPVMVQVPGDTVIIQDTIFLQREQKTYSAEDYRAWVSGYDPRLDSIQVFPERKIITVSPKRKRWGVGVSAGYGVSAGGFSPFIGVSVNYNLFSF